MIDKNANYNEDTLNIVYDIVAKFIGVDKATLTPDTALEAFDLTLEDYHEIYREACVRRGVNLKRITIPCLSTRRRLLNGR